MAKVAKCKAVKRTVAFENKYTYTKAASRITIAITSQLLWTTCVHVRTHEGANAADLLVGLLINWAR